MPVTIDGNEFIHVYESNVPPEPILFSDLFQSATSNDEVGLGKIIVRGLKLGASNAVTNRTLIQAAVDAAAVAGGAEIIIPRIGGDGVAIDRVIYIPYHYIGVRLRDHVYLTRTTVVDQTTDPLGIGSCFWWRGSVVPGGINGAYLIADYPVKVSGNGIAIKTAGYVHATGNVHHAVFFSNCNRPYVENIWAYDGLVGGVTIGSSYDGTIINCRAFGSVYDNGVMLLGNPTHIGPLDTSNPATWGLGKMINCEGHNCANHGLSIFGSYRAQILGGRVQSCGNNTGQEIAGPAGGLGVEWDQVNATIDYGIICSEVAIDNCWGFAARSNCAGTQFLDLKITRTKVPTASAYVTADTEGNQGSAIFLQAGAKNCIVRADIDGSSGALDNGTATAGTTGTLSNSAKAWTVNQWADHHIRIISGTGTGQTRTIASNTATVLTVSTNWTINPDATSVYSIFKMTTKYGIKLQGGSGVFPGGKFNVNVRNCLKRAIWGVAVDEITLEKTCLFENNGDPTETTGSSNAPYAVYIINNGTSAAGTGHLLVDGEFRNNLGGCVHTSNVGVVTHASPRGHNNGQAWATAYHMFNHSTPQLMRYGESTIHTDTNAKCARILLVTGGVKAVGDPTTILGDQTSTNAKADVSATTRIGKATDNIQNITFTVNLTPNTDQGSVSLGTMTGNTSVNAPTGTPRQGDDVSFYFTQDATGTRVITWNAAWKGATLTSAGAAGQRALVTFRYDGSGWREFRNSGWG